MGEKRHYWYIGAGLFVLVALFAHILVPEHPHPFEAIPPASAAHEHAAGEAAHEHTQDEATTGTPHTHSVLLGAVMHANDKKLLVLLLSSAFIALALGAQNLFSFLCRGQVREPRWNERLCSVRAALSRSHRQQVHPHHWQSECYATASVFSCS